MFITVSGSLPPGEVVPRQLPLDDRPRKIVPEESYPYQQFSPRQIPRMITPWMIAHKESCSRGNLSHPRTIASEENCFPPVQLLPKKMTLEKNSRTIATMDACFRTILLKENSLEDNFPYSTQSSKIIPSNEYYELTEVHYILLRVLRFRINSSWFMIHESTLKFQIWNMKIQISFESF